MITRRVLEMNNLACESGHKSIQANNSRKANNFRAHQFDGVIVFTKACGPFLNMLTDITQLFDYCNIGPAGESSANRPNGRSIWLLAATGSHQLLPLECSQ